VRGAKRCFTQWALPWWWLGSTVANSRRCGRGLGTVPLPKPSPYHVARIASATPVLPWSSPRITVGLAVVGAVNEPAGPVAITRPLTDHSAGHLFHHHHPRVQGHTPPKAVATPSGIWAAGMIMGSSVAQQSPRAAGLSPWWSCQILLEQSRPADARHSGLQTDPSGVAAPNDGRLWTASKYRRRHLGAWAWRIQDRGIRCWGAAPSRPLKHCPGSIQEST
jgi:hypothetical protein